MCRNINSRKLSCGICQWLPPCSQLPPLIDTHIYNPCASFSIYPLTTRLSDPAARRFYTIPTAAYCLVLRRPVLRATGSKVFGCVKVERLHNLLSGVYARPAPVGTEESAQRPSAPCLLQQTKSSRVPASPVQTPTELLSDRNS